MGCEKFSLSISVSLPVMKLERINRGLPGENSVEVCESLWGSCLQPHLEKAGPSTCYRGHAGGRGVETALQDLLFLYFRFRVKLTILLSPRDMLLINSRELSLISFHFIVFLLCHWPIFSCFHFSQRSTRECGTVFQSTYSSSHSHWRR